VELFLALLQARPAVGASFLVGFGNAILLCCWCRSFNLDAFGRFVGGLHAHLVAWLIFRPQMNNASNEITMIGENWYVFGVVRQIVDFIVKAASWCSL